MTERARQGAKQKGPVLAATPGLSTSGPVGAAARGRPCRGYRSPRAASRRAPGGSPRSAPRGSPGAAPRPEPPPVPPPSVRSMSRISVASCARTSASSGPPALRCSCTRASSSRRPSPAIAACAYSAPPGASEALSAFESAASPLTQFLPGDFLAEPLALLGQLHALGRERDHVRLAVDLDLALELLVEFGSHSGPLTCKPMHAVDGNSKPPRHTAAGPAGGIPSYLMSPSALSASTTLGRAWKACT